MTKEQDIEMINQVYSKFGLRVDTCIEGIKINQYRIKLPFDIDVKKLLKLENNLVIALEESNVKVFQDVNELVIEKKVSDDILKMEDVFQGDIFHRTNNLNLILGKDMHNNTIITSLVKAPHMLVSGTTGSGKTQLLHCFISSLLVGNHVCEIILIDPKGNEFNVYKDIDTVDFIDNVNDAIDKLKWLTELMDARYRKMAALGVSDISQTDLARYVCIIDEFADLIGTDKKIEKYVVRLAQKARACGIHLIIGTQYPVGDVITGLIKANIPTRVCLKVNDRIQSRVAIDRPGGEKLIGHGDLLFLANGMYEPIHIQAPFISEENKQEVVRVCTPIFAGRNEYKNSPEPPKKKVGFFQGLKNIINSHGSMTTNEFVALHYTKK